MNQQLHPVMAQAVAPFLSMQPSAAPISLNDDDQYVIDLRTLRVVAHLGGRRGPRQVKCGQALVTGMRARFMGVA